MKFLKYLLLTIIVFLAALFFFMPHDAILSYAVARAEKMAAMNGVYISVSNSETNKTLVKEYQFNNLKADLPLIAFECENAIVKPSYLKSILSHSLICEIDLSAGAITLLTGQKAEWKQGKADIRTDGKVLFAENILFTGQTSLNGKIELSLKKMKIEHADLHIKALPELDRAFEIVSKTGILPMKKSNDGEWRLER